MNTKHAEHLAKRLLSGELTTEDFVEQLAPGPTADLGDAQLDLDRQGRCGFPEVVFGQGKTVEMLRRIFRRLLDEGVDVLATRVSPEKATELKAEFADGEYNPIGKTFRIPLAGGEKTGAIGAKKGHVAIVTAGTSDRPVAEEARETVRWMGAKVTMVQDVGVAGPHRFPANLHKLKAADAVVVIAGMEGALPSIVGGYVPCPVIGVPTSVGYGANFSGIAALLGMLNSCAANVTVVNIDARFKGGYIAGLIAQGRLGCEGKAAGKGR